MIIIIVCVCACVCVDTVQLMGQNLRGEMNADIAGAKLCLSDSRFIQVIAKSLSISCKEVRALPIRRLKGITSTIFLFSMYRVTKIIPLNHLL